MQVIGIYIHDGNEKILKVLHKNTWYPFGKYSDCSKILTDKNMYSTIKKEIKENQKFCENLYSFPWNSESKPTININCIVGENGSGKSTLLDIYYRIINNFSYQFEKKINIQYKPIWSNGFNADLYFEIDDEIGFISIKNNLDLENNPKKKIVFNYNKQNKQMNYKSFNTLQKNIFNSFFYTISSNYSIYSNSNDYEGWKNRLYQKNDGYITPIVLLPYRKEEDYSIDFYKEEQLAKERIKVLSLLLYFTKKEFFIPNLKPIRIEYNYDSNNLKELATKLDYYKRNKNYNNDVYLIIQNYWKRFIKEKQNKLLKKYPSINNNVIEYLSYKTLKIFMTYETYKKEFYWKNIFIDYNKNGKEKSKELIERLISTRLCNKKNIDHINLKIIQCITFVEKEVYKSKDYYINFESFKEVLQEEIYSEESIYAYDKVYINLLPNFFKTTLIFETTNPDNSKSEVTLADLSSGQQHLLGSLSYLIYHMKNIGSINNTEDRIIYKNVSLILDETELYYHPEFQRTFIYNLLDAIYRSNLRKGIDEQKGITSINILLVTHSPYILSDIPYKNILTLQEGIPNKEEYKLPHTLCANNYDILKSNFFLKSYLGELSQKIIFKFLKIKLLTEDSEETNFYTSFIDEIGDPFFHDLLYSKLLEKKGLSYNRRKIDEYKKKLERLTENEKNRLQQNSIN